MDRADVTVVCCYNDPKQYKKLVEDLAAGYRKVIDDVYAAGCRNLQFDDCSWGMLVDPRACLIFDTDEKGLEAIKEQMLAANNLAIEGKPEDLVRSEERRVGKECRSRWSPYH